MTFTAKYPGRCEACGEEVKGEEVEHTDTGLVHVLCPEESFVNSEGRRVPAPVCPRCFMVIPASGECGVCFP